MKVKQSYKYILFCVFLVLFNVVFSQQFKSEQDRIKYADKLFEEKKFIEAEPHYLQILSLNRTSSEYNFKYGTCLLFSAADKEKCLSYLRFASRQPDVDPRAFYYLGRAFHVNYMFGDAIKAYEEFSKKADSKTQNELQVDQYISMCKNGRRLLSNISELVVIDKKEVKDDRFMYSYDLSNIGGKILITTEFQTKYDQKMGHRAVVHFPPNQDDVIFFSSYGKDGATGLDLYRIRRLPDGTWSEPQRLPDNINTRYDDDFGFLHPDGTTFYFSSKGHNSMGGYDIFKCQYNKDANTFTRPENLDFKINTPSDDFLYVADSLNNEAFFSSNRANKAGNYTVYNVRVEVIPIMNVILAGNFKNEIDKTAKNATIKVRDPIRDLEIGTFSASSQNGDYLIILPKGGRYEFIVEAKGSKVHTAQVEVPAQKEIKPLKQEILLVKQNNEEKLIVRNLFDQEVENASDIIAQAMKIIANPEVNVGQFLQTQEPVVENIDMNLSDVELIAMAEKWAAEAKEEAIKVGEKKEQAYLVASEKIDEAEDLLEEAKRKLQEANAEKNESDKLALLKEAEDLLETAQILKNQAKTAVSLGDELERTAESKTKEASRSEKYAQGIKSALQSKSNDEALKQLREMQDFIKNVTEVDVNKGNTYDEAREKANAAQKEADKMLDKANSIRDEQEDLRRQETRLQNELKATKKKDEKEKIQKKIDENRELIKVLENDSKLTFEKLEKLQKEASRLDKEAELLGNMYNRIEFADTKDTPLSNQQKSDLKSKVNQTGMDQAIAQTNSKVQEEKQKAQALLAQANKTESTTPYSTGNEVYKGFENQLTSTNELSGEEKLRKQNEINQKWVAQIENDIKEIDKKITKEKDSQRKEELEIEKESLSALKGEKQQEIQANQKAIASTTAKTTPSENILAQEEAALKSGNTAEAYSHRKAYGESLANQKNELEEQLATAKNKEAKEIKTKLDELNKEIEKSNNQEAELKRKMIADAVVQSGAETPLNQAKTVASSGKPANATEAANQNKEIEKLDDILANKELEIANSFRAMGIDPLTDPLASAELEDIAYVRESLNRRKEENESISGDVASVHSNPTKTATNPITTDTKLNQLNTGWESAQKTSPASENELKNRIAQSEDYLEAIDDKIGLTQAAINNTTGAEDRADLQNQLNVLNQTRNTVNQSINRDTKKLNELSTVATNEVKTTHSQPDEKTSSTGTLNPDQYSSSTAQRMVENANKQDPKITQLTDKQTELEERISSSTDEKLRTKDQKELEKTNRDLANAQIVKSNQISKAHEEEYKSLQQAAGANKSTNLTPEDRQKVTELTLRSADNFNEAKSLRNDANSLRNPEEKAEKLRQANEKEVAAIQQQQEANIITKNNQIAGNPLVASDTKARQIENTEKNYTAATISEFEVKTSLGEIKSTHSNAQNELNAQQKNIDQIRQSEEKITDLSNQLESTSDPKQQQKIAKQIEAEEKKKASKEIQVNPAAEKAIEIELASAQISNSDKKEAVKTAGIDKKEDLALATRHEQLAQTKLIEAGQLREEAKKERDPVNKSEKLRSALGAEQAAIKHLQEADKIYSRLLDEMVVTLSRGKDAENKEVTAQDLRFMASNFDAKADEQIATADAMRDGLPKTPKNQVNQTNQRINDLENSAKENRSLASDLKSASKELELRDELKNQANPSITKEEAFVVRTLPEYDVIYTKQTEVEKLDNAVKTKQDEQARLAKEIEKYDLLAEQSRTASEATRNKKEKTELHNKTTEYETKKADLQREYDTYDSDIQLTMEQRNALMKERNQLITNLEESKRRQVAGLLTSDMDKIPVKAPIVIPTTNVIASNFVPPPVLTQQIFTTTETAPYSDSNPIPINPEGPKGLYYKVQVGAFRRAVSNETFKEFAPVSAEQINDGLIRYQVGYFTEFVIANDAKNQVRGIGYSDAFVVAFYDGKRISLAEARNIRDGQSTPQVAVNQNGATQPVNTTTPVNTTRPTTNNTTTETVSSATPENIRELTSYYDAVPNAAKANQVEVIQGLFYTVQVGVYSKPVTADQLFNLSPLNSELTQNQLIRYTTGNFANTTDAAQRRDAIREVGIADAFVVAYYNGKKITAAEANRLLQENGTSILAFNPDGSLRKITTGAQTSPSTPEIKVETPPTPPVSNVRYAVDLGEYEGNVPGSIANVFITNPEIKITSEKISDTRSRYLTSQYNTQAEAERTMQTFRSKGISGAKLIYYKAGREVSEAEAKSPSIVSPITEEPTTPQYANVIYRIYLGEYGENVPANVSMAMIEMQSEGIESIKSTNGKTVYLAGKYKTEAEANSIRRKFAEAGISAPTTKAYSDGREITLEEARQSTGN